MPAYLRDNYRGSSESFVLVINELSIAVNGELRALDGLIPNTIIANLLRWYPRVVQLLGGLSNSSADFDDVMASVAPDTLAALRECSELLHIHRPEPLIAVDTLEQLKDLVRELLGVLAADIELDTRLRDLLLSHARTMENDILSAEAKGTARLRGSLYETIGSIYLNADLVSRNNADSATWQKVTAILGTIAAALSLSTAAVQALQGAHSPPAIKNVIVVEQPQPTHSEPTDGT